jgi:hypothetical protein
LRYSVTDSGGAWTTATLGDSMDHDPLIAFDRDQAYIAYWREFPNDRHVRGRAHFCLRQASTSVGEPCMAVGRRRPRSAGRPPGAFGSTVVLHAIVWNDRTHLHGRRSRARSSALGTGPMPTAPCVGIGDDGRARVAYWGGSLRYGTFNGRLRPRTSRGPTDGPAMLVLGSGTNRTSRTSLRCRRVAAAWTN